MFLAVPRPHTRGSPLPERDARPLLIAARYRIDRGRPMAAASLQVLGTTRDCLGTPFRSHEEAALGLATYSDCPVSSSVRNRDVDVVETEPRANLPYRS